VRRYRPGGLCSNGSILSRAAESLLGNSETFRSLGSWGSCLFSAAGENLRAAARHAAYPGVFAASQSE
ncbi:MAG TPA: hypothetical protein VMD29_15190, partial [Terracidiphilus sp.]|nr:hypothetical protein [Terracidiphilus sp.]